MDWPRGWKRHVENECSRMVSVLVCPSVHSNPNARCLHLVSKQTDNVSENQVLRIMPAPERDPLTVH